ncbi:hypothetical protein B0T25DRAFT_614755 [Lasiosphaeria hispida]|uniref:Nephrocystin 3-like N-terminal domain-containing protein n=1 Tax=Lasiosphaeria hispida TaxID=260671 RepID=A0AAJ0H861_9PEZI|nr:hypothetical protein B0T25DRAFT_614755 [Lasiosphaeria hispida]
MAQTKESGFDGRRRRVVDWLVSKDYADDQQLYSSQRAPMTCTWFLECHEYDMWLNTKSRVLFCSGDPGTGKTLLTSAVVSNLQQKFSPISPDRLRAGIAYVYFREQTVQSAPADAASQSPESLLRNLLGQLLAALPDTADAMPFFAHAWKLYDAHLLHDSARQPSIDDISDAFCRTAAWYDYVFVALDALDECPAESRRFLSSLAKAQAKLDLRIFATCRADTAIPHFGEDTRISRDIRASEADIQRYLELRIPEVDHVLRGDESLKQQAIQGITTKSNGSFLLARVYMDILASGTDTASVLHEKLESFQPAGDGSTALDAAYSGIVDMINGQSSDQEGLAQRALAAVAFAPLALTGLQLRHALAITDDTKHIHLSHRTIGEYLRSREEWLRGANGRMAASCVAYLLFRDFSREPIMDHKWVEARELEQLVRKNLLLRYASSAWACYLSRASREAIPRLLRRLADHPNNLRLSFQVHTMARRRLFPKGLTITHIVSYLGSPDFIPALKREGLLNLHARDSNGWTALHWAVCLKDVSAEDMVKTLLDFGCKVNAVDEDARTPLSYVAEHGRPGLARLLLDRKAKTEPRGNALSPLAQACACGHAEVAQVLLDRGAKVNAKSGTPGRYRQTPLAAAIAGDSEEGLFGTALDAALSTGNKEVEDLLRSYGATNWTKEFEPVEALDSREHFVWGAIGRYGGHFLASVAVGNDKQIQQHIDMKVGLFRTAIRNKNVRSIKFHTDFSVMAFDALVKQAKRDMEREEAIRNGNIQKPPQAGGGRGRGLRAAFLASCIAPILNFIVWRRVPETARRKEDEEAHATSSAAAKLDLITSAAVRILSDAIEDGDEEIVQMLSRSWVDALKSMFANDVNDNMAQELVASRAKEFEGFFRDGEMEKANLMAKLALELMAAAIAGRKRQDTGQERERLAKALSGIWSLTLRKVIENGSGSKEAYQQLEAFLQRIKIDITDQIKEKNWDYIRRIGPACVEVLAGLVSDDNVPAADMVAQLIVEGWQMADDEKMREVDATLIRELEQEFKTSIKSLAEDAEADFEMTRPWIIAGVLFKVLYAAVRYNSAPIMRNIAQLIISNMSALHSNTSPEFVARVRNRLVETVPVWCEVDENPVYLLEAVLAVLSALSEPSGALTGLETRVRDILVTPARRDDAGRIEDVIRQLRVHLGAHGNEILPGLRNACQERRLFPSCTSSHRSPMRRCCTK